MKFSSAVFLFAVLLGLVCGIFLGAYSPNAYAGKIYPDWRSKQFMTVNDLTAFLNTLPDDRAIEAKVLVINSQRSFLGVLSSPYFLIYRPGGAK